MRKIAFSILHNQEDAEDAVQIAMLNICKHVKKIQDPNDKDAKWYVMQATKNVSTGWKRRNGKHGEKHGPIHIKIGGWIVSSDV